MKKEYAVVLSYYISPEAMSDFKQKKIKGELDYIAKQIDLEDLTKKEYRPLYAQVYQGFESEINDHFPPVHKKVHKLLSDLNRFAKFEIVLRGVHTNSRALVGVWCITDDMGLSWVPQFLDETGTKQRLSTRMLKKMGVI